MTIEWLAGNRIRGTTAERPALGLPSGSVGGWVEVGRTTLGSAGTTITVSGLADKRYYKILTSSKGSGSPDYTARINSDTGSTYASRWMDNGSGENTGVSRTSMLYDSVGGGFNHKFNIGYITNLASKEKLSINHSADSDTSAASTAPSRSETVHKWANTSDALSAFSLISTVNMDIGSEVVVLGWDPTDTHTTNFWEELASVELGTTANNIDSGTISAKKYLWVQCFIESSGGATNASVQFNGDTANNYSNRLSINGGADSTDTSSGNIGCFSTGSADENGFINFFAINNSANEKLCVGSNVSVSTTGAGSAPDRREGVGKWANTSAQITSINISEATAGTYGAKTLLKVWGSD